LVHNLFDRATDIIYNNFNPPASACQIYYDLIILSVKTLHTLVFFCKFRYSVAFREKSQHTKKIANNEKRASRFAKNQISAKCRSPARAIIMPLSCQNGIFLGIPIKKIPVRYSR